MVRTIVPCKNCDREPCVCCACGGYMNDWHSHASDCPEVGGNYDYKKEGKWWKCPHCGGSDNWFDRSFIEYQNEDGDWVVEGPWTRCADCGMADDEPPSQ